MRSCAGSDIKITIRVKPGASRTRVGGRFGDDQLIVSVSAPAVDGRATTAALTALAAALGVGSADVRLVSGRTSRSKVVEIPDPASAAFIALLGT